MGEVYKGVAVASGDPVAIKLVRPEMSRDPEVIALFKREAQILHDLLHDAIVRYYVFSLEPELQRYYIAMEFVDGVSLQKRLADGPLSPAEARILLKRIGGALEQAHSRGVIHRDISSDNIILPGGDVRKAKIVDFGIARAARAGEGTIIGGGFAGKYKYVSPEQLGLFGGEVTPKSDIYSFGLVIAEALRGEPLDMGGSQVEVIEKRRTVPDLSGIDVSLRPAADGDARARPAGPPGEHGGDRRLGRRGDHAPVRRARPGAAAECAEAPRRRPRHRGRGGRSSSRRAAARRSICSATSLGLGGRSSTVAISTGSPTPAFTPPALGPKETSTPAATSDPGGDAGARPNRPRRARRSRRTCCSNRCRRSRADQLRHARPGDGRRALSRRAARSSAIPRARASSCMRRPAPPAGLAFKSLGGGRSEIAGEPTAAGQGEFEIVAVTAAGKKRAHEGRLDRQSASASLAERPQASPPRPPPRRRNRRWASSIWSRRRPGPPIAPACRRSARSEAVAASRGTGPAGRA